MVRLLIQRWGSHINCDIGGDDDGVDVYVYVAYIRPCPVRILCNGDVKLGSLGVVVLRWIGE